MFAKSKLWDELKITPRPEKKYVAGRLAIHYGNEIIDNLERFVLLFVLLIGMYCLADTVFVFYNSQSNLTGFQNKPEAIEAIQAVNKKEYVSWLSFEDTPIDYAVMQAEDNEKYLNTSAFGEYSLSGAVFLDCRNNRYFRDDYSVVYGHHLSGDYMFGTLDKFRDEEYFNEHKVGLLEVADGNVYRINVFAFIDGDAQDDEIFDPELKMEERNLEKYIKTHAVNYLPEVKNTGRIIALTTCKTPLSTTRTIILGYLEKIDQNVQYHEELLQD